MIGRREQTRIFERLRKICLALPETSERLSHGDTDHYGSGHFAAWCAAPLGAEDTLVRSDPETFFVPPYVGYRGWVGIRLDRDPDWDQVKAIIEDAYAQVVVREPV